MYYEDHLAASENEISSSNFCTLVDTSVMLYEEKHRNLRPEKVKSRCHSKKEEEESDNKLFPKKKRTSVVAKRNSEQNHQNLNGASTSSSLRDLSTIPDDSSVPRNPLQRLSSFSSSCLRDYKIASHSEAKTLQSPPSSSALLVEYNTGKSEKMEMTNPPNPNSQSSYRKRKISGSKSKKAKVDPYSWKGKEPPEWLVTLMGKMKGIEGVPRLIYEKTLNETDVNPDQSRLLMPFKKLICNDFLTPVESRILAEEDDKRGVGAALVDQEEVKWGVILKKREMKKLDSGKKTSNYAIICGWNDIVKANGLKDCDDISIWSFRWEGILCFALVLPPPPPDIA